MTAEELRRDTQTALGVPDHFVEYITDEFVIETQGLSEAEGDDASIPGSGDVSPGPDEEARPSGIGPEAVLVKRYGHRPRWDPLRRRYLVFGGGSSTNKCGAGYFYWYWRNGDAAYTAGFCGPSKGYAYLFMGWR